MCGIAGFVPNQPKDVTELLLQLEQSLAHRGPDDKGFYVWDGHKAHLGPEPINLKANIALVHRRLKIQDTTDDAFQPMISHDQRYCLVFNGEIYNFIELKNQLTQLGYNFKSQSDTEVLLVAWQHWNTEVFSKIEGMFAFAIFDSHAQQLILARDSFGIKPLYYTLSQGFGFASELKALLNIKGLSTQPDPQAMYETVVLNRCDSNSHTFYQAIKPVPSGHYLVYNLQNRTLSEPTSYWQLNTTTIDISYSQAKEKLRSLWFESIRYHQRSQVPIGAALSGGIDSSVITATLAKEQFKLPTFSYISSDKKISEQKWVQLMLEHTKVLSYTTHLEPQNFVNTFESVIKTQDQPFGSLSILAQFVVYELAKQHDIKVLLNGQGADELFGGYYRYLGHRAKYLILQKQFIKAFMLTAFAGLRYQLYRPSALSTLATSKSKPLLTPKHINSEWFLNHNVKLPPIFGHTSLKSKLKDNLLGSDLLSLLRVDDHNAMHFGIETRVPFLYRPLVEFVMSLPEHFLINHKAVTKSILRDSFIQELPKPIYSRKDKIGFVAKEKNLQISQALQHEFRDRILSLPFINQGYITKKTSLEDLLYHKPYFRALCTSYYL